MLALAGFAMWAALTTGRAAQEATRATETAVALEDARYAVGAEESLERKYRLEPGPEILARHSAAARDMVRALETARRVADASERATIQGVLKHQGGYLSAIHALFTAVDRAQQRRVEAIDSAQVDPRFEAIETAVADLASGARSDSETALRSLRAAERLVAIATPVAFVIGMVFLTLFARLLVGAAGLRHQTLHDALTGLPNRILFQDRLDQALRAAERSRSPLAVLMIDLDRFKEVNDTLGHSTGDVLLQMIGPRLQATLRASDTIARMGGDEFAVLLPDTDLDGARRVAESLRRAMEEPFDLPRLGVTSEASVGIARYPEHGTDTETLVQRADVAMYVAKNRRSGYAVYSADEDPHDPERLALVAELRRAISDDELVLHYQPKVDLESGAVNGVEALARWRHPDRGLLGPDQFIPAAEQTGLIRPLTLWVIERALRQSRTWLDEGRRLSVAVNLAVASLLDPELADDVSGLLSKYGVPGELLALEITENSVMQDPARAIEMLSRLSALGVRLSIDDFGTGYSSLAYLQRLPVDELKIDKGFVINMDERPGDEMIVRSTIDLARNLKLAVVAEGVESARTLEALRSLACDQAQGFHVSRPVPADELVHWLAEREAGHVPGRG